MRFPMYSIRILASVLIASGMLLTGCAQNNQSATVKGSGKDLAKQWAKAAKEPVEAENTTLEPEPKLLPMTHFSAGSLYEKQGNYVKAIDQYNKAIELNTTFVAAYSRVGLCYAKAGQYDLAIQALKRAADLQPASATLWNNLGFAYLAKENYVQAEECFGKALLAKPSFARARMNMAIALVQQKRDTEALGHMLRVAAEPFGYYNLGAMQMAAGRCVDARESFEHALRLRVDFPAARKGLEEAMARLPKSPAASVQEQAAAVGAGVVPPGETCLVRAAPATRPIEGIDDEPAIANAPVRCTAAELTARPEVTRDVVEVRLWEPDRFACVRTVAFTGDAGRPLTLPMPVGSAVAPAEVALVPAIACDRTLRSADAVRSVADLDLWSLRWAAWTDAIAYLHVDVAVVANQELGEVLSKWLCALNELESVTPIVYGAMAYADDS